MIYDPLDELAITSDEAQRRGLVSYEYQPRPRRTFRNIPRKTGMAINVLVRVQRAREAKIIMAMTPEERAEKLLR